MAEQQKLFWATVVQSIQHSVYQLDILGAQFRPIENMNTQLSVHQVECILVMINDETMMQWMWGRQESNTPDGVFDSLSKCQVCV